MDAIPVLSQVKSFAQWASGNSEGARRTQEHFLRLCPVVSQGTSAVQALAGDTEGARETQLQFLHGVNSMVDAVPVVGHVKGGIHYACGDKEGGDNAMKASSRSTLVMGGGVGGFLVGGPAGAMAGGVYGGLVADTAISVVEIVADEKTAQGYGIVRTITNIVEDPTDGGEYVDLVGGLGMDVVAGYAAGEGIGRKVKYVLEENKLKRVVGPKGAKQVVDVGESMKKIQAENNIPSNKPHIHTQATDLETGQNFQGNNKQVRNFIGNKDHMGGPAKPTELQVRVPDAQVTIRRNPATCAEQQAYNGIYKNRPDAQPAQIRSATARWDPVQGQPVTVRGCTNCQQFGPAMGDVVTDRLPNAVPIPSRVNVSRVAGMAAAAAGVCMLKEEKPN